MKTLISSTKCIVLWMSNLYYRLTVKEFYQRNKWEGILTSVNVGITHLKTFFLEIFYQLQVKVVFYNRQLTNRDNF